MSASSSDSKKEEVLRNYFCLHGARTSPGESHDLCFFEHGCEGDGAVDSIALIVSLSFLRSASFSCQLNVQGRISDMC